MRRCELNTRKFYLINFFVFKPPILRYLLVVFLSFFLYLCLPLEVINVDSKFKININYLFQPFMKFLLSLFLTFSLTLFSQNPITKTILGREYSVNYKNENNEFEICEQKKDNPKVCIKRTIENEDEFSFIKTLNSVFEKQFDTYKYNFFGEEKTLSEILLFNYSKNSITNKLDDFNGSINSIELKIENYPDYFPLFKIIKKDEENYELVTSDDVINKLSKFKLKETDDTKKAAEFERAIKIALNTLIDEIVKNDFEELLSELYNTSISKTEDYVYLTTEKLIKKQDTTKALPYNFYYLIKNKNIYVRVCEVNVEDSCKVYGPFLSSISENEFVNSITNQHNEFEDGETANQTVISKVYYMIVAKKESKKIDTVKKEINDSITNIFKKIENAENTFSGQFVINKEVPLYKYKYKKVYDKKKKDSIRIRTKDLEEANTKLIVDSVNIRFFNNRADNITIVGKLDNDNKNTRVFTNRIYSLPLREFNHREQTNQLSNKDGKMLTYYYDDVLDYLPYKKFNYAVKNGEIKIKEGDSIKAVERKIGDYFTGIFFSDFLGLNTNNSNSLIVAEGRIRIPFNLRNFRLHTLFDNITAYASVNLFSGFEDSSRKIELDDTFDDDETSEANAQKFTTNNFNLLTNNNIDAGILVTPYTLEWKAASTFIHLRYGLRFLRTGVEYNLKEQNTVLIDNVSTVQETIVERKGFQVFSIGQEAEINFEIRPQSSVGADVTVGLNWFRATGTNKNDVDFLTTNNSPNIKVMTNIYALTNSEDSNSGVYFRLGGHYNLGNYKVFPQIMVGYATNLSSFVNKLKKED